MLGPKPRGSDLIGWWAPRAYGFLKVPQMILMCGQDENYLPYFTPNVNYVESCKPCWDIDTIQAH